MMQDFPRILFVGGGSGGHISIIKGLVDYMRQMGFDTDKLMVVGGKLGMINDPGKSLDERLIPELGIKYSFIRGGKLHRAFKLQTLKLIWGVIPGFFDALKILKEFRPDIVFATGGYVIVPMVMAAKSLGIKVVLHEQTMTAGLANKIASTFADKIFVTFDESLKYYPRNKAIKTGNIIRKEVFNNQIDEDIFRDLVAVIKNAKEESRKIVYITGGSLGAHKINEFILNNIEEFIKEYSVILQTGDNQLHNDFEKIVNKVRELGIDKYIYITKFVRTEIGYILNNCDYVICRPGANTLYELSALGKKAVMVPLWVTSKNDQKKNANWYQENFRGRVIAEKKLSLEKLLLSFKELDALESRKVNDSYKRAEEKIVEQLRKFYG